MREVPGEVTVSVHYARHLGPRFAQAGVTLRFEVAEAFAFSSAADWPQDDCTAAVREGVEGALRERVGALPGAHVTLEQIAWHEVDSSADAFRRAAHAAVHASFIV